MQVFLLAHTPQPERVVAAAAKNCYSAADTQELYDNLTEEKVADFLHMLTEIGHASPIEHASFTFGIEGVSRSLLAHRLLQRQVPALCPGEPVFLCHAAGHRGLSPGAGDLPAGYGGGPARL